MSTMSIRPSPVTGRATAVVLGLMLAFALGACASMPEEPGAGTGAGPGKTVGAATSATAPAAKNVASSQAQQPTSTDVLAGPGLQRYLMVQAEQIGLVNVADNGEHTFFRFQTPPTGIEIYDQDGKPLVPVTFGTALGVAGVHEGILLKRAGANSFVTPNPRRRGDPKPSFEGDRQIAEVLRELDAQSIALPAFQRAMQRLQAAAPTPAAAPADAAWRSSASSAVASTMVPPANALPGSVMSAPVRILPAPRPDYTVAETARGRLYRLFFASGGRAVVSPDDGLQRIEDEALQASYVRVTGYTDSTGGTEANSLLARERAQTVRNYLVQRGVGADRIGVGWEANARYLADNDTARGRALNRRVDVLIQVDRFTTSDARR